MQLHNFSPKHLPKIKGIITQFLRKYGNGRITHQAMNWLQQLPPEKAEKGTQITAALENNKLIGIILFGTYGIEEAVIAVHPNYRAQRIGEKLLKHSLESLGKIYTRVACDNLPSLKLCFSCDMVAIDLFTGPTGKPTLWLAGGNWNKHDIASSSSFSPSKP